MIVDSIRFYIEYRNSQRVMLPVNPEKLEVQGPGTNTTVNLVGSGDVNILKSPGLRKVTLESWIPKNNDGAGYILEDAPNYEATFYRDYFTAVQKQKEPVNLIITGLDITLQMGLESFNYHWEGSDEDMWYTLEFKEWKSYKADVVQVAQPQSPAEATPAVERKEPVRENIPKEVAVGVTVRVNGRLHRDSNGTAPGQTEKNATRKISHIAKEKPYPYHVTTLEGGWRGWVEAGAVEVI